MDDIEQWEELKKRRLVGEIVKGTVLRTRSFGVFVDIGEKHEGYLTQYVLPCQKMGQHFLRKSTRSPEKLL